MLHTFLSFFIVFFIILGIEGFGGNLSPPEVNERINGTVQLNCTAYEANGELNFFLDNNERVPETYIKRTNETYIEMIRVYSRPIKENYTCKQGFNNIDVSQVIVDKPMDRVVGFKCRTSNLTNVHCSFKMPLAFLPIEYRFFVALNDGKKAAKRTFLNQDGKGGYSADIKISESTNSLLNASLNCTLKAKNLFYRSSEEFNYQLLEILTPDPVADLKVLEDLTTHSSVFVTFSLPKVIEKVTSAMVFDVRLIDEDTFSWRNISSRRIQITGREGFLVIDNLEYANTRYTMKIRMKSSFAADDEEMWSTYKEISFKTSSKLPDNAPDTCENCFNVMDNGNIVVYWMEVPKLHQNAENFSYLIRGWDENEEELIHENLNRTSLLLHKSLFTSNVRIKFFSVNSFGVSKRFSELFIQKDLSQANRKHLKIRKELDNSEYKISWKNVEEFAVESYTVVWCQQRNELPNQCDGSIHFQTIPSNVSEFKIESPTSHHFGVAVNFQNKSLGRGIDWAECTAAKSNEIGQVHSVWSSVNTPNDITLHWKLNCVDEPIVKGFNITYCLADSKSINLCNDEVVILSDNEELNQHELKNLKPYRLYNISIALMSETRLGIPKAPIITRTLEGAPTAPRNFRDVSINQQSIDLTWNRPLEVNGASMTYQLWYNDHRININDNNTMNETFEFNLNNLDVFTNYTITVVACTSACSDSSESLTLRTAMGAPSAILQPKLKDLSERRVELSWETPIVLGGNLDYFQLKMIPSNKLGNLETKVFRIHRKTRSCYIEKFNCEDNVLFTIRAVNIEHRAENFLEEIPNNKSTNCFDIIEPIEGEVAGQYYSNWSQPVIHHCQSQMSLVMIAAVIITAVSTMTSLYLFVRLYQRYKEMKDIYIVWPKGLDPSEISPPTTSHDLYNGVKDLDLLKNHKLTGIQEEEEENAEQEVFLQIGPKPDEIFLNTKQNEISMPFTVNTRTNDYFHQKPKLMSTNNKTKSAPTSPEKKSNDYIEFSKDSVVEKGTGYTKMYVPQRITSGSVDGYLDMTGKNKSPVKSDSGYTLNEIKLFIKDSELKNNGYIGKRASILIDPQQKGAHKIISNGYVGIQPR